MLKARLINSYCQAWAGVRNDEGHSGDKDIVVTKNEYWMGPDITIASADKGRVRAFGRVWDFDGRSAEICQIDWKGPR